MKLAQLFSKFSQLKWGVPDFDSANREVRNLSFDSRQVESGTVFIAIRGTQADGHQYLEKAALAGAIALIVEDEAKVPVSFQGAVVQVKDTRAALDILASHFYGTPSRELFCVGVTGTKGKTTLSHLVEAILNEFGWPCGVIGTIDHHLKSQRWSTERTTPDPILFQRRLQEFVSLGAEALSLEVSSHALCQSRVESVEFDVGVFTNLSRDHLDFHKDMEEYFQAKNRLFTELLVRSNKKTKFAIINVDDPYGRRIEAHPAFTFWTYGEQRDGIVNPNFSFIINEQSFAGTKFSLYSPQGHHEFFTPLTGVYNVANATAAIAVGLAAGATLDTCAKALAKTCVPGRLEPVPNNRGIYVFVDYAHTDASLESVLKNVGDIRPKGAQIITVFGCGGNRDRGKRPLMLKAALSGSEKVILTSDNPRTEDPKAIIQDALAGFENESRVLVEVDRRQAIARAIELAKPGDLVLIAGKGHETYQEIGNEKLPFSDVEVARELLK